MIPCPLPSACTTRDGVQYDKQEADTELSETAAFWWTRMHLCWQWFLLTIVSLSVPCAGDGLCVYKVVSHLQAYAALLKHLV